MISLNAKLLKHFQSVLSCQFGCELDAQLSVFLNPKDNKLHVINDITLDDLETLRINSFGLYFGEYNTDQTQIRLSIEGSQIIGPIATKNVLEVSRNQFMRWMQGNSIDDIPPDKQMVGYVIVKHNNDYGAVGTFKDGILLNFVPKNRRIPQSS